VLDLRVVPRALRHEGAKRPRSPPSLRRHHREHRPEEETELMDRIVDEPYAQDGIVWITARIDTQRFKLGAESPGDWNASYPGMDPTVLDKARRLAREWEREHPADAAKLFVEAAAHPRRAP
jgi:hypothetical protein